MSRFTILLSSIAVATLVAVVAGCGDSGDDSAEPAATSASADEHVEQADQADHAEHAEHADHEGDDQHADHDQHAPPVELAKYADVLGKLPMEDRMAVYKQGLCPVTGHPLGAMGTPRKVTIKDRELFLCCPTCEEKITADPDTYLAKLAK